MTPFSFQVGFSAKLGIVQLVQLAHLFRNDPDMAAGEISSFLGGIDAPQPWMLRNSPALHGRFRKILLRYV